MKLAMIGLGKMGGNMVRRMRRGGIEVVGFDRAFEVVAQLAKEDGMIAASSVGDAVTKLTPPRIVWLMLPSGDATEHQIRALAPMLSKGDIIVDGGNSNYHDTQRRGAWLAMMHDCPKVRAARRRAMANRPAAFPARPISMSSLSGQGRAAVLQQASSPKRASTCC